MKVLGELSLSCIQVDNEYTIEGITRFYRTPHLSLSLLYIAANKAHDRMHFLKILLIPEFHWPFLFRYAHCKRKLLFARLPPPPLSFYHSLTLFFCRGVIKEIENSLGSY